MTAPDPNLDTDRGDAERHGDENLDVEIWMGSRP
jgi:hypothetical protein